MTFTNQPQAPDSRPVCNPELQLKTVEQIWPLLNINEEFSQTDVSMVIGANEKSRAPLDVRLESTDASPPHWTRLKVSYATGFGNERMNAYLYLPKNATPPYQIVIFMHGSGVLNNKKTYDEVAETPTGGWLYPEMLDPRWARAASTRLEGQFRALGRLGVDPR